MADKQTFFDTEKQKQLQEKLKTENPMALPSLVKIVLNASTKEFLADKKQIEIMMSDLMTITGQKPKVTTARISVASFKLREGDKIGLVVTLRGKRMYDFFEKLVKIVLPRVKDFSGIDAESFDQNGNITIGFSEHTVFPEIDPGSVDKLRSLEITIVTQSENQEASKVLLETLGMPFKKIKS